MEITNWITKCYSTYANKNQHVFTKPKPILPFRFTQNKTFDLSEIIDNNTIKRRKEKTLIEMLEEEKLNTNKQLSQIKWVDIVGFGIVGLGLWACYTYSGYKISFTHTPH